MLDLVALATVADVAPLDRRKPRLCAPGLKVMAAANAWVLTRCRCRRLDTRPSAYHLGFVLGPRINAGGRIGKADLGARLLPAATHMKPRDGRKA